MAKAHNLRWGSRPEALTAPLSQMIYDRAPRALATKQGERRSDGLIRVVRTFLGRRVVAPRACDESRVTRMHVHVSGRLTKPLT